MKSRSFGMCLRGDMSFVGPRPPLRLYVERYPEIYARVLQSRPGITGLASLHFHAHEERLLARCKIGGRNRCGLCPSLHSPKGAA